MAATMWCVGLPISVWILVFCGTLAAGKNSDALGKESLTLTLEHAIDTGSELVFQPRGVISIKNMKSSFGSYKDEEEISSEELERLKTAAAKGNFYHIRIPMQPENEEDGKEISYLKTFINACSLLQSNLSDVIKLHVDSTGHVFAVGLSTTSADCSDFSIHRLSSRSLERFNTTVMISHVTPGPVPDTQTYIRKLEDERRATQQGKGKDNKSFLGKYWMYIVPLVIFLMLSGQEAPAAGGGAAGGAAAAGGGGGGGS